MRRAARNRRAWLLLLASGALACSSPGPARRDQFYRLELGPPCGTLASPAFPGTLVVERLRADGLTGRRAIVYRPDAASPELRHYAYYRWVEPPPQALQHGLADHLRAAGAAQQVVTPQMRAEADFVLNGRIVRLERVLEGGPGVVAELELGVMRASDRRVLLQQRYREEQAVNGSTMDPAVRAWGEAVGRILDRFVADSAGGAIPGCEAR